MLMFQNTRNKKLNIAIIVKGNPKLPDSEILANYNCQNQKVSSTIVVILTMVDVPDGLEDISEVVIFGVESEQIEEENDAYNDLRAELGRDGMINNNYSMNIFQVLPRRLKRTWQS